MKTPSTTPDKIITSADNSLLKLWSECLAPKGIRKHGQFLISGEKAVMDTLERFPSLARNLILDGEAHSSAHDPGEKTVLESVRFAREQTKSNETRFSVAALAPELFKSLDLFGTRWPLLVMSTPEIPNADLTVEPEGLEVLCALQDPANLGALIRSAAAFGVSQVVLLKEAASPFHPKAIRAASATTLALKLMRGPSIKDLPKIAEATKDTPWVALDMLGGPIDKFMWPRGARLVLGEEGQGVPESSIFQFVSIPMAPGVESLNATVASSIALYSYRQKNPLR